MLQFALRCLSTFSVCKQLKDIVPKSKWVALILILLAIVAIGAWAYFVYYESKRIDKLRKLQFTVVKDDVEGFANIKVGSNSYKVHEDLENPKDAAIQMDNLNTQAMKLIAFLNMKYIKRPEAMKAIKSNKQKIVRNGIKSLVKNFKTTNLEENIPERSGGDTSYVINKGDVFAMCIRDPKQKNKIEDNTNDLTFVLIHELAHLFTSSYGHDKLFWHNFRFLLEEAVEAGVYTPVNYNQTGSPYCGIVVTYSPLFDETLTTYKTN